MYANRICKQVKKMFDLIRTFFLKSKKNLWNLKQYRLVKNMITG